MYQFNFINTITRFSQTYTVTHQINTTFLKGRPQGTNETFDVVMSLQPMSKELLDMLESGDWDSAEYVGFQYSSDKLPIKKDLMLATSKGDLKCIAIDRWTDYGVYVTGWKRLDAYQTESTESVV